MNILACVKKYGGITFSEVPFSEVDSLILSELTYLDFGGLADGPSFEVLIGELKGMSERMAENAVHPRDSRLLLEAVCESRRYSALKVGYYRERNDDALPERFAAVSFLLEDGSIYSAFRGTDVTIAAWHEDFDLLFQNAIPSQKDAAKYLADMLRAERGMFYVGGHSKGGNLAVYAASALSEEDSKRIRTIFDHDGPGFREGFFETPGYMRISDLVQKTVPHDALVGLLLTHTDRLRIVKSRKVLLGQHNPFAWEAEDFRSFHILTSLSPISLRAESALRNWLMGMSRKRRKRFVFVLFQVIGASGVWKVPDLFRTPIRTFRKMRRAYRALPKDDRQLIRKWGSILLKIRLRIVRKERAKQKSKRQSRKRERGGKR